MAFSGCQNKSFHMLISCSLVKKKNKNKNQHSKLPLKIMEISNFFSAMAHFSTTPTVN
jgi:hypothetical protein